MTAKRTDSPHGVDVEFDREDLVHAFSARVVGRARSYVRRLENVVVSQGTVTAEVEGARRYRVQLDTVGGLFGRCSCPVRVDCKHAAALGLYLVEGKPALDTAESLALAQPRAPETGDLDAWLLRLGASLERDQTPVPASTTVIYMLHRDHNGWVIEPMRASRLRNGRYGRASRLSYYVNPEIAVPGWMTTADRRLVDLARSLRDDHSGGTPLGLLDGALMQAFAASDRLLWQGGTLPLRYGPRRREMPAWIARGEGAVIGFASGITALPLATPHYLDDVEGVIGPLENDLPPRVAAELLARADEVPAAAIAALQRGLAAAGVELEIVGELDLGEHDEREPAPEVSGAQMTPRAVFTLKASSVSWSDSTVDVSLFAGYDDIECPLGHWQADGPRGRDLLAEARYAARARALVAGEPAPGYVPQHEVIRELSLFYAERVVPILRSEGWEVELIGDFTVAPPITDVDFYEDILEDSAGGDWFTFSLGVDIDGERHQLLPLILEALADKTIDLDLSALRRGGGEGMLLTVARDERGMPSERVYIPRDRLARWLRPLLELQMRGLEDGALRLSAPLVADITSDLDASGEYAAAAALQRVRDKIAQLIDLPPREAPAGFVGELRDYQKRGLAWLRFLHDAGYGGLLADDMGLGKTIQLLALAEELREAGTLTLEHPMLVVAPRSVVENWRRECERFTPSVTTHAHLGPKRISTSEELGRTAHLIVTSYQTLLRDIALFRKITWTTVVLDEAQAIKNAATKLRKGIVTLRATSRLCVTGTPIENHLGELWSQIDVAMPGLLGSQRQFKSMFARPIDEGDTERLELLRRRIRPFMLRRRKDEVELNLPPKTEIIEYVELGGGQRDLYESLRLVLDKRVRDALADRGIGSSTMIVLDALLKLRQSCCDPRLVKTDEAKGVSESAKLERLMVMLDDLVAEGRSTLVFSQFATMLELIREACAERNIETVMLTGATRDRETPIRQFQRGDVPVFLVSLKAGGVGLNLTRADTVIHYDPWWNPAAELQATDRAHRIGQTKPVFVYKLVADGTVEEKILELQAKKRALTDAALTQAGAGHLTAEDLSALFQV